MAEAKGKTDSRRGYFDVDGSGAMTELIFLLELSGPMAAFESDLIDGFNGMIARLREEREDILVWLWKNASQCLDMNTRVPITEDSVLIEQGCFTRLLTLARQYRREHPEDFVEQDGERAGGGLFDSFGGSIHMAQLVYPEARSEDRPVRTMFIIVTDNAKIETANQYYWSWYSSRKRRRAGNSFSSVRVSTRSRSLKVSAFLPRMPPRSPVMRRVCERTSRRSGQ